MKHRLGPVCLLLTTLVLAGCSRQSTTLVSGRLSAEKIEPGRPLPIQPTRVFDIGEPISLLLRNARFRDSYLDIVIYSISHRGKEVLSRTIPIKQKIDTSLDYLQLPNGFAIAFPGRYRIAFTQLGKPIASTVITIRSNSSQ